MVFPRTFPRLTFSVFFGNFRHIPSSDRRSERDCKPPRLGSWLTCATWCVSLPLYVWSGYPPLHLQCESHPSLSRDLCSSSGLWSRFYYCVENRNKKKIRELSVFDPDLAPWLTLRKSQTSLYGPKYVRAIEVWLFIEVIRAFFTLSYMSYL